MNTGKIVIYQARDKKVRLEVNLDQDTIWLTQKQMSKLFEKDTRTVNEHLQNIFKDKELERRSVIRKFRITALDGKAYETNLYNLDVIISVGYRVRSLNGTRFRIWATNVLKNHLLDGYTLNEKRLLEQEEKFRDLQRAIELIEAKSHENLLEDQSASLLHVISEYAKSLTILEQYDSKRLVLQKTRKPRFVLTYEDCKELISGLSKELVKKYEAGNLFGREVDCRLKGIVKNLLQTFNKNELYQSLEEKSAHLLYFVIKDHPFADGNKRIAAMLFIYFLSRNNYLKKPSGELKINDNALVALALLIATSEPKDKDIMIKVITNLLK
ncbi:MAG: virulence protein RhuM/Fic/DOC family protein [Candidatus Omnitrophica bacterium]|nr:virulence protein RhuM/Fic/DOC family protein [Candidatus Omnitrophota bacterium]